MVKLFTLIMMMIMMMMVMMMMMTMMMMIMMTVTIIIDIVIVAVAVEASLLCRCCRFCYSCYCLCLVPFSIVEVICISFLTGGLYDAANASVVFHLLHLVSHCSSASGKASVCSARRTAGCLEYTHNLGGGGKDTV